MKIVSEDNRRYSLTSKLYDKVYGRENTRFSMGSGNLEAVITDLLDEGEFEDIVVYLDVVPENEHTGRLLLKLYTKFLNNKNVYIVPIICSKYCLLLSLHELGYDLGREEIGILNGSLDYHKTLYSEEKSLEKVAKAIKAGMNLSNGYFEDDNSDSFKERSVVYIKNHTAFENADLLNRYFKTITIEYKSALKEFLNFYDKVFKVEGLENYSQGIKILKSLLQ